MSGHLLKSLALTAALAAGGLATYAAEGPAPLPKTEADWKNYFKELARNKEAHSLFLLGSYYAAGHPELGKGRPDPAEAFRYYLKAAEMNHAEAQYRVGYSYEKKLGVRAANLEVAHKWYLKAANQEVPAAQLRVGEMFFIGEGVMRDYPQAFHYLSKAAERGLPDAQRLLGDCYKVGMGTLRNDVKALTWYTIAARQENEKAMSNRKNIMTLMRFDEIEAAEKAAREFRPKP
ncbi:MAG: Beta-lactamase [Verrucomicrobia bacterium]|jgi:TPR repeat protein|nr:Beta-lactamase [Verrucomicrobiota bacterium]